MEPSSTRRLIRAAIKNISTSFHTEVELRNLLRRIGGGGTAAPTDTVLLEEEYDKLEVTDEVGDVLAETTPIYSFLFAMPPKFTAWVVQEDTGGANIRGIYASLDSATEENEEDLLLGMETSEGGAGSGFFLYIEDMQIACGPT